MSTKEKRLKVPFDPNVIHYFNFTVIYMEVTGLPDYDRYNFAVYYTQLCPEPDSVTLDERGT